MRIGFIGSGAMAAAIVRGGVVAGMSASDFLFTDTHGICAPMLAAKPGASAISSNGSLTYQVDTLVLDVKPRVQSAVIKTIAHIVREHPEMCIASLAAGRIVELIAKDFGTAVPIIRVMLNVNVQIGRSMSTIYPPGTSEEQMVVIEALMSKVGRLIRTEEKDFPTFQAFVGCSPVQVFQIIEALTKAGVKHGLTREVSAVTAAQALAGSADLVLEASERGTVPSELIDRICSPGDTTITGLLATEAQGMSTYPISAAEAAIAYSAEIPTRIR